VNERIRQLLSQAGVHYEVLPKDTVYEKFAELIVKECMLINRQRLFADCEGDTHRVAHNNALWCSLSDMQEHFGVEP
jgi:hypothetical protein